MVVDRSSNRARYRSRHAHGRRTLLVAFVIGIELYFLQHAADALPEELTEEMRANAEDLVPRVNALLADFQKDTGFARVQRSGWRPASYNANFMHLDAGGAPVRGGAARSCHITGEGVDVADNDGALDAWLDKFEDGKGGNSKLAEHGLYREHPGATPSWCHLQTRTPGSGHRTFHP